MRFIGEIRIRRVTESRYNPEDPTALAKKESQLFRQMVYVLKNVSRGYREEIMRQPLKSPSLFFKMKHTLL